MAVLAVSQQPKQAKCFLSGPAKRRQQVSSWEY